MKIELTEEESSTYMDFLYERKEYIQGLRSITSKFLAQGTPDRKTAKVYQQKLHDYIVINR